jgi:hypothetical protein
MYVCMYVPIFTDIYRLPESGVLELVTQVAKCMYVCMYACMYVCMYVPIFTDIYRLPESRILELVT